MARRRVLIAGAGIGGLAAALALSQRGFDVEVLERRQAPSETGAGIQLGPNGTRILQSLGVGPSLAPVVASPERIVARSGTTGAVITELPLGAAIEARHGAPYWTMHRRDLHRALWGAVTGTAVRVTLGFEVSDAREAGDAVEVIATDGRRADGGLLVGADGLWSRVRELVCADRTTATASGHALTPVGKSATRAVIDMAAVPPMLRGSAAGLWLAPGSHLVHYPVSGGRELAVVLVADDPSSASGGWDADPKPGWLDTATRALPQLARDLIAAGSGWRRWSLYEMPRLTQWSRSRLVLLGDAAHPVLPFLAQGAALALEDAVVLADRLAAEPHAPAQAAERYVADRRDRARSVADAARRNGRIYHLGGLAARARDLAMGTAGGARLMAGYDWLYGWGKT